MLTKYAPGIVAIVLALATIGGVAYAANDSSPRTVDDPASATSSIVPYGAR